MEQSIRQRLQKGEYDEITGAGQFARTLTGHLHEVSRDRHLGVRYSHDLIPPKGERQEPSPLKKKKATLTSGPQVLTSLSYLAEPTGLEPATSDVTGRRSNQLNYDSALKIQT